MHKSTSTRANSQAAEVDILIGNMGNGLGAGGGFCAGSYHVCKHQVSCIPPSYQGYKLIK
jgi:7-keto-8-aminopelargonate synthetase-like enzyme